MSKRSLLPRLCFPVCLRKHLAKQPGVTALLMAAMLGRVPRSCYGKRDRPIFTAARQVPLRLLSLVDEIRPLAGCYERNSSVNGIKYFSGNVDKGLIPEWLRFDCPKAMAALLRKYLYDNLCGSFFSPLVKIQIMSLTNRSGIDLHSKPNHCQVYCGHALITIDTRFL